jgi:hypothetical protein
MNDFSKLIISKRERGGVRERERVGGRDRGV